MPLVNKIINFWFWGKMNLKISTPENNFTLNDFFTLDSIFSAKIDEPIFSIK